jgi:hypothetical protein
MQMHAIPFKEFVLLNLDKDIEVARRPAAQTRFTLTGQPDTGASFHTFGDVDREGAFFLDATCARTGFARILNRLS